MTAESTLPFSGKDYDKLERAVFPTIRRRDKYGDVGDVNTVVVGEPGDREEIGKVEIVGKETITLSELNNQLFMFDTQTESWDDAYDSLNGFYQNVVGPREPLTLYWNRWIDCGDNAGP